MQFTSTTQINLLLSQLLLLSFLLTSRGRCCPRAAPHAVASLTHCIRTLLEAICTFISSCVHEPEWSDHTEGTPQERKLYRKSTCVCVCEKKRESGRAGPSESCTRDVRDGLQAQPEPGRQGEVVGSGGCWFNIWMYV